MNLGSQIKDALSIAIQDWGVPVIYRVVESSFNHETQQITETYSETSVRALIESQQSTLPETTNGNGVSCSVRIVVGQNELPSDAPQLTDRIVIDSEEFQIVSFDQDTTTGLLSMNLIRR